MAKQILWLDNDPRYTDPYVQALRDRGDSVAVVTNVTDAEALIRKNPYDLTIIDAMIPTIDEAEEEVYPPRETDRGLKMGLLFYKRMKEILDQKKIAVLVMTVRLDEVIQNELIEAGLPTEAFITKLAVRRVNTFLEAVDLICQSGTSK
jgi:CheY-like chemotaxis protein